MASAVSIVTQLVLSRLQGPGGIQDTLGNLVSEDAEAPVVAVLRQQVRLDASDKAPGTVYPVVSVYCEKLTNDLREKFRTFSGKVYMAAEVRVSDDRPDLVSGQLQQCIDSVVQCLDQSRGNWGSGAFFSGVYEIQFQPMRRGGKNFLQEATVTFPVEFSKG